MKNHIILLLLCLLCLVNCSTKENKQDKETPTSSEQAKEEQIFDLKGKIFWEGNGASIKIIEGDKPKVLFTNFEGKDEYPFKRIKLVNNKIGYLISGSIKEFGDLSKDGTPEFFIKNITTNNEYLYGFKLVVAIANDSINVLKQNKLSGVQLKCLNIMEEEVIFNFDSLSDGGPYLVEHTKYVYFDAEKENCELYEQADVKTYYTLSKDSTTLQLVETNSCPIENNTIDLATLFKLEAPRLGYISFGLDRDSFNATITPNLNACGEDENMGIGHLEKLAGIRLEGGKAKKRTDLMPAIEEEFLNVNPTFIAWVRENLIPEPDKKQHNGLTYNFIFNKAKESFRSYALTRLFIEHEDKEFLLREYAEAKATINNNSPNRETPESKSNLIFDRSDWVDKQLKKFGLGENYEINLYGFWIRRMLDGSEPEIWKTLKYILKMYDEEWYNKTGLTQLIAIDSTTFVRNKQEAKANPIIKGKEAIPAGIVSEKDGVITILARNGKIKTYDSNGGGDYEDSYDISGYWPEKAIIIITLQSYEWGSLILLDLNTGSEQYAQAFYPSNGNKIFLQEQDDAEQFATYLVLREIDKNGFKLIKIYPKLEIKDGFWKNEDFYFEQHYSQDGNPFFKIGKVGFDDILAYSPPIKDIINKSDSIPTDSTVVE